MTDAIHLLVERYGLLAVFLGCVAEGESAAILAGFFAHQRIFEIWQSYLAAASGAFAGDMMFFVAGQRFASTRLVTGLRGQPGFDRALRLVTGHPIAFVLLNRYAYGFRLIGGVAAGLSGIPTATFVALNLLSSAIWAGLFCAIGYVFGLGAEMIVGAALKKHERLLVALAVGAAVLLLGWGGSQFFSRRAAAS